jgi:hypothetical protein
MPIYPIAANVQVSATALPLPDGASTEATLAAVNAKLPALVSGKIPVDAVVSATVGPISFAQGTTVALSSMTTAGTTTIAAPSATRKILTVFNEGPALVYIAPGASVTNTSYQVSLTAGDYWEAPAAQTGFAHTATFSGTGAIRICAVS